MKLSSLSRITVGQTVASKYRRRSTTCLPVAGVFIPSVGPDTVDGESGVWEVTSTITSVKLDVTPRRWRRVVGFRKRHDVESLGRHWAEGQIPGQVSS